MTWTIYIKVRDRKREKIKKGKNKSQHFGFAFTNTLGRPHCEMCIQNLKTLALIDAELIRWKNLLERKKNGQIKGLISHMWLIH